MRWKIFYGDGSTFSSEDGHPGQAPALNVQVVVQIDAMGRWVMYAQQDFYCWGWRSRNEWVPTDETGTTDYLYHHPDWKAVLYGRWISNEQYEKVFAAADRFWNKCRS